MASDPSGWTPPNPSTTNSRSGARSVGPLVGPLSLPPSVSVSLSLSLYRFLSFVSLRAGVSQVHWQNARWEDGTLAEVGQMFATNWVAAIQRGLYKNGENTSVMLPRGGYAGSWRHGAGLWSGDIWCDFDTLQSQVRTGVSAQISGFGLWTTDIGGFSAPPGGSCTPGNSSYDELVTRWFQFGVTCPIFRQHGSRPTEIWHYGPEAQRTLTSIIHWRASIKPYLQQEMRKLNATGRPINRPLWWDFPADRSAWLVDDEYMFGDEYLVAPVLRAGARSRSVYLPTAGTATTTWRHVWTNASYKGGENYTIDAPLDSFPLFRRDALVAAREIE